MDYIIPDKDTLLHLYLTEQKTIRAIARIYSCPRAPITKMLKQCNVPIREHDTYIPTKFTLTEEQRKTRGEMLNRYSEERNQARKKAYDANPNLCQYCDKPILRQVGIDLKETKIKKYCDQSCAAKQNNRIPKRLKILETRPKTEVRKSDLCAHARAIMKDIPKVCIRCGYSKSVQTCHIRAVKDFPKTTTVAEINELSNLMYLCPNCHWEFDHGLL